MRLERVSLSILLIALLVLLIVPFWRGLALSQLRQTVPGARHTVWDNSTRPYVPSRHPKTDAQLLREHPRDFRLRLALAQEALVNGEATPTRRNRELAARAVTALVRDYPRQGVAYTLFFGLPNYGECDIPARAEGNGILPEDTPKRWQNQYQPTLEQRENCQRAIAVLNKGIAVAPDNGWFHVARAVYLYALHKDAEALAEVHSAAVAPQFTDYTDIREDAWNYLCDLRGSFDPYRRDHSGATWYESFAVTRNTARITGNLAYQQISNADADKGIRMAMDVVGAGHNMGKHSPTLVHALVARNIIAIGAAALDPHYQPEPDEKQRAKMLAHYAAYLVSHGHRREAAELAEQWQQGENLVAMVHSYTGSDQGEEALTELPAVFAVATGALAVLLISSLIWAVGFLVTRKRCGDSLWDRRAGVTSMLLSCLVIAPVVGSLISGSYGNPIRAILQQAGVDQHPQDPIWLFIPAAVALAAFGVGLVRTMMRPPREGKSASLPVWSLLLVYASAVASIGYIGFGITDFKESSEFFATIDIIKTGVLVLLPSVALAAYAALRANQSRTGRTTPSGFTLAATLRYGSAIAAGLFAIIYLGLLISTSVVGMRADAFGRDALKHEAAVVRNAFK